MLRARFRTIRLKMEGCVEWELANESMYHIQSAIEVDGLMMNLTYDAYSHSARRIISVDIISLCAIVDDLRGRQAD